MATNPLGADALAALLGDQARVRVRNTSAAADVAFITAVAVARHAADGSVLSDTEFGLELAAGEEAYFEPQPPSADAPVLLEVLLRVRIEAGSVASADGQPALIDLYVAAEGSAAGEAARGFDCGLRRHDGRIESDEQLVPGFVDLVAFARAVR
ncbi:MAG: hypothetical protein JNM26_13400 [Ideonella sp.]|nr:hypothetical protein [Ideonella sp.]